ncbi:MAG TPA: ABC transporter ATP-binding protein [Pyrinomonadaceae bacterium]|jgi:lipopolysaccharide transport system ATP-binding protein|nr:ABC transporter ATP-binding protein [Pyrinomonadaceae bacterium]
MQPIITVAGLGKKYYIGAREAPRPTWLQALANSLGNNVPLLLGRFGPRHPSIWALRNVDLEVFPGEVLGIIGSNGAGKSTLLKILARVTRPTTGKANLYGRGGSLLGVSTGFHPDLTGRENIYLNGAILGMKRNEIGRKFDQIVEFAGIEKFLDTQTKRYSSGMFLRLGFAIAAHLDPDILLLDEVLTTADASFQRKCLERIKRVSEAGTAVLFVSHNLKSVSSICHRAIHFHAGEILDCGKPDEVVTNYLNQFAV